MLRGPQHKRKIPNDIKPPPFVLSTVEGLRGVFQQPVSLASLANLVAQIRSRGPQTPILLISAYVSQDAGKIISGDVAEFMHKPINPTALIATVRCLFLLIVAS